MSLARSRKPRFTDNRFITPGRRRSAFVAKENIDPPKRGVTEVSMLTFRWRWSCFETSTSATSRNRCRSGIGSSPFAGAAFGERAPRSARRRLRPRRRRPKSRRHSPRRSCNEKRFSLENLVRGADYRAVVALRENRVLPCARELPPFLLSSFLIAAGKCFSQRAPPERKSLTSPIFTSGHSGRDVRESEKDGGEAGART